MRPARQRATALVILLPALAIALAAPVLGGQNEVQSWFFFYPEPCNDLKVAALKCHLCHKDEGSTVLNSYGQAIAGNRNHDPRLVEDVDSDGDGRTNLQEIQDCTLPGDAASVPVRRLAWGTVKGRFHH